VEKSKGRPAPNIDRQILESLGWGVMVVGRWSRVIFAYNRRMAEITGVPAAEALGRSVADVFGHVGGLDFEALDAEIRDTGRFEARSLQIERSGGELAFRHLRGDVLEGLAGAEEGVVVSLQDVSEREFMRQSMSRYLAREVAELVLSSRPGEPIGGREVEVAVLVADMRDSTATAEGLTPEELFEILNAYLGPMVEVVARHGGVIDKFTGDGFMAVFGAPTSTGDEAKRAISAALALSREVDQLAAKRAGDGLLRLDLGYGIHWGPALAGSLGSLARMEYTVVGDTVNVAHRVQALAVGGEILTTRAAARAAGNGFQWGEGRWVRIRGRKAPVKILPVLGHLDSPEEEGAP
jgi:PAS domain S-box-containing protein